MRCGTHSPSRAAARLRNPTRRRHRRRRIRACAATCATSSRSRTPRSRATTKRSRSSPTSATWRAPPHSWPRAAADWWSCGTCSGGRCFPEPSKPEVHERYAGAMPNVGPLELAVVLVVALLVLGPKRLPEVGRSLGNGLREFKDSMSGDGHHELEHDDVEHDDVE